MYTYILHEYNLEACEYDAEPRGDNGPPRIGRTQLVEERDVAGGDGQLTLDRRGADELVYEIEEQDEERVVVVELAGDEAVDERRLVGHHQRLEHIQVHDVHALLELRGARAIVLHQLGEHEAQEATRAQLVSVKRLIVIGYLLQRLQRATLHHAGEQADQVLLRIGGVEVEALSLWLLLLVCHVTYQWLARVVERLDQEVDA